MSISEPHASAEGEVNTSWLHYSCKFSLKLNMSIFHWCEYVQTTVFMNIILFKHGVVAGGCLKWCNDIKVAPKRDFHSRSARCVIPLHRTTGSGSSSHSTSYRITLNTRLTKMGSILCQKRHFSCTKTKRERFTRYPLSSLAESNSFR